MTVKLTNKNFWISSVLMLLVVFSFSACKDKKGGSGSGESYTLAMQLKEGETFSLDVDTKINIDMSVMGQDMTTTMNIGGLSQFDVLKNDGKSKELALTYKNFKMDGAVKMSGKESSMPDNGIGERMQNKRVVLTMNEKNEITAVSGADSLLDAMATTPETRMQVEQMFSEQQLNSMFGQSFQFYPDKPVKVGDKWNKDIKLNTGAMEVKMNTEYELVEVKGDIAVISSKGKIDSKGKMNQGGVEMEVDMNGTATGTMNVGLKDGYIRDGRQTMDLTANAEAMGQKIPMKMKMENIVKGTR
ncbi:hypothetical protein JMG10_14135 [Nostoc ellipsosporum NOK]|jgi:hypothetical protein|nr:hypothetical protein [Nostoc ellipsosporum NOK]